MSKVSVIVPVYNVEQYVAKCLDSIINQTYKNLEIICVDDGSTDKSGYICDEYAKKDSRIKVFHKANGGLASARNAALTHVTGDYIGFVDSDDWIEPEMYETLVHNLEQNSVDMVCCNFSKIYNDRIDVMKNEWDIKNSVLDTADILYYAFNRDHHKGFAIYVWNKLFTADKIKNYRFDESLAEAEDVDFISKVIAVNNMKGFYIEKSLYNYLQRSSSLTYSKDLNMRADFLKSYSKVIEACNEFTEALIWIKRFYCYHASLIAELAYEQGNSEQLKRFQKEIRKYLSEYISTNKDKPERIERINNILNLEI